MKERTLAIIKPDAVKAKNVGGIVSLIEKAGFEMPRLQKIRLSADQGRLFYAAHKNKPFFEELVEFISSGPVVVMVLEKESAIKEWRDLMGATDPKQAKEGTIRKLYGASIGANAVHGSDSAEAAAFEIQQFYPDLY